MYLFAEYYRISVVRVEGTFLKLGRWLMWYIGIVTFMKNWKCEGTGCIEANKGKRSSMANRKTKSRAN